MIRLGIRFEAFESCLWALWLSRKSQWNTFRKCHAQKYIETCVLIGPQRLYRKITVGIRSLSTRKPHVSVKYFIERWHFSWMRRNFQCRIRLKRFFVFPFSPSNRIHLDIAIPVYCTAVEHGSEREWNFLWNKFKFATDPMEKMIIVDSLGCTKHANLVKAKRNYTLIHSWINKCVISIFPRFNFRNISIWFSPMKSHSNTKLSRLHQHGNKSKITIWS